MALLQNYLLQPSTWFGLAKIGCSLALFAGNWGSPFVNSALALFGLIDVFRNEPLPVPSHKTALRYKAMPLPRR